MANRPRRTAAKVQPARWKQAVAAALIGTPLLLAAIEIGLRLLGVADTPEVRVDAYSCFMEFEPGTHMRHDRAGLVHDLWLDSNGFRVPEAVARGQGAVPAAACRVLALGDSFTEGFYVKPEQTWPSQVEARLRDLGYDVRIDNGGFRTRSIQDARHAALTRWAGLGHDLVVVEHTSNDLQDLVDAAVAGCDVSRVGWVARSRLYGLAQAAAARFNAAQGRTSATAQQCRQAAADYRELLVSTAAAVRASQRQFVFVMLEPFLCAGLGAGESAFHEYTAELRASLGEVGVHFVDATAALREPGRNFAPVDYHPNPAGYAAIGAIVADAIHQSRVLNHCRAGT